MFSENNAQFVKIPEDELLHISGGSSSILDEQGIEVKEGRFITSSLTSYASGNAPKYSAGEFVKIKWRIRSELEVPCDAEIVGVSSKKDGGLLFQKFTYSVRILSCPNNDMIGLIESNVHENCLFR